MDWDNATNWAANLTTGTGTKAVDDWRLPTMAANPSYGESYDGSTSTGYNVPGSSSEMASLFFKTLGNKSNVDTSGNYQAGGGLTNTGSFQNMQSSGYWLGTEYVPSPNRAWTFHTGLTNQLGSDKGYAAWSAMAVRSGDVMAAVPEPETYMMLLLGLGAVGALSRRRAPALGSLAV